MKTPALFIAAAGSIALIVSGCAESQPGMPSAKLSPQSSAHSSPGKNDSPERAANLAKLNSEDRQLAEAQGYCVVTDDPLGSMGPPIKVLVDDQAVFVCCKGCEKKAKADPEKTLAKVAKLQAQVKSEHSQN